MATDDRGATDGETDGAPARHAGAAQELRRSRGKFMTAFGQIVLSMAATARYRHHTLADLNHLLLEPLLRDRIAIATVAADPSDGDGPETDWAARGLVGVAIWATVSEEVDAKIREQIKAGVFPVQMRRDDWTSGQKTWLLDVIAPTRKLRTALTSNLHQVFQGREVTVHPIVRSLVDAGALSGGAGAAASAPPPGPAG